MRVSMGSLGQGYDVSAGMFGDAPVSLDTLNQLPTQSASEDTLNNAIISAAAGSIPVTGGGTVAAPSSSSTYLYIGLAVVGALVVFGMKKR